MHLNRKCSTNIKTDFCSKQDLDNRHRWQGISRWDWRYTINREDMQYEFLKELLWQMAEDGDNGGPLNASVFDLVRAIFQGRQMVGWIRR
jgi:hypothetical protein